MFSHLFTTAGNSLSLELVSGMGNETISYGPDLAVLEIIMSNQILNKVLRIQ